MPQMMRDESHASGETDPLPHPPDGPEPAAARGRDLLLILAITLVVLLSIRLTIGAPAAGPAVMLVLLAVQAVVPLIAVYLVVVRRRGVSWRQIGLRPAPRGWYSRAVLLALLTLFLVAGVNLAMQALTGEPLRNPQIEILAPVAVSWPALLGLLAVAGIVFPFVEEILFRGLLYGWLRGRFGVAAGFVLSAVMFAGAHGILILLPALFVVGLMLAWTRERSGSLWPPIILHGSFNALMVLLLYAVLAAGALPD